MTTHRWAQAYAAGFTDDDRKRVTPLVPSADAFVRFFKDVFKAEMIDPSTERQKAPWFVLLSIADEDEATKKLHLRFNPENPLTPEDFLDVCRICYLMRVDGTGDLAVDPSTTPEGLYPKSLLEEPTATTTAAPEAAAPIEMTEPIVEKKADVEAPPPYTEAELSWARRKPGRPRTVVTGGHMAIPPPIDEKAMMRALSVKLNNATRLARSKGRK